MKKVLKYAGPTLILLLLAGLAWAIKSDILEIGEGNLVTITRNGSNQMVLKDLNNPSGVALNTLFNKGDNETVTGNTTFSGTVTNSGAVTNSSTTTFGGAITLDGIAPDFTSDTGEDITFDPATTGNVVLTSPAILHGDSVLLTGGHGDFSTTTSGYLVSGGVTHTSTVGLPMPAAGSILEISVCANVSAFTTTGTLTYQVRKADTPVFSVVSDSVTGTGVQALNAAQARAVDTFAQGDLLQLYLDKTDSFSGTVNGIATVKVVLDD